jgi:HD-GYP domain-containing protein (c-di-GMP phosphodiesterase class II)
MGAILHVLEGPDTGRLFALTGDITIGRNAENTIVLNDAAVSGVHTKIVKDEQGKFAILDNSSTNGTFLNGREQRACDLKHGDRITIGSTTFAFEIRDTGGGIKGAGADLGLVRATLGKKDDASDPSLKVDFDGLSRVQLEMHFRRSLIINRLDERISTLDDVNAMLAAVLDAAIAGAGAGSGLLLLVDETSGEMLSNVARSTNGVEVTFSKSLAYEVSSTGKGYVGEPPEDSGAAGLVLCAPFTTTRKTNGVLYLCNPGPRGFGESELEAVSKIARRAGVSISAARWRVDFELLFSSMVDAIMNTIQAKDVYTRGHSERVRHYSKLLGKELGLGSEELYRLTLGAGLHDIGKVGMPDSVLKHNKSARLTPGQMVEVRKHPARGAQILRDISFLADVIPAAELHHEDWDGGGYPHGLKGEEIPLIARIVAVADTYDAITTDRPYQKGKSYEEGHEILRKIAGKRLQPELVEKFIEGWKRYRKGPRRTLRTPRGEASVEEAAKAAEAATERLGDGPEIDDDLSQIIEIG